MVAGLSSIEHQRQTGAWWDGLTDEARAEILFSLADRIPLTDITAYKLPYNHLKFATRLAILKWYEEVNRVSSQG